MSSSSLPPVGSWLVRKATAFFKQDVQSDGASSTGVTTDPHGTLRTGVVERAGPGQQDVVVRLSQHERCVCRVVIPVGHSVLGASQTALPAVGSVVVVYSAAATASKGIVLGVLPDMNFHAKDAHPEAFGDMAAMESSATAHTEQAYVEPYDNKKDKAKLDANLNRPVDALPGDFVVRNEQGATLAVTKFATTIGASASAEVRTSMIDDQVRIASGHYIHLNAGGISQIFNDGGFVSGETGLTSHQCERSGCKDYGTPIFEDKGESGIWARLRTALTGRWQSVKAKIVPKARLQVFTGYLGDLINIFVSRPDDAFNPETQDDQSKANGLFHAHVDSSGRVGLRTAAGFTIQRWDRIPVPKRLKQPWDPEGDKVDDDAVVDEKKPFEFDASRPYARSLQMRDALAWRNKLAVQRLHERSTGAGKKDFFLPEERDLPVPPDKYDELGRGTEKYKDNDGRNAFLTIEDDGSIIMRDAWGSEIAMRGGSIVITCPGQIELRSGKSVVALAGHDLILKAKESADLSATNRDVRIKAEGNLQMTGEGILLDSTGVGQGAWTGSGEAAHGTGIVLRAEESTVYARGKYVHASAERDMRFETFNKDKENEGAINFSARAIRMDATQSIYATCNGTSGVFVTRTLSVMSGLGVVLASEHGVGIFNGSRMQVQQWADIEDNVYGITVPALRKQAELLQGTDWLGVFAPGGMREDIKFTFRSSAEYGTVRAAEVQGTSTFKIYQAMWAYMLENSSPMIRGTADVWSENAVNGTLPWPGTDAYASGTGYVVLKTETNIDDPATGFPKPRKELRATGGTVSDRSLAEYQVMSHT